MAREAAAGTDGAHQGQGIRLRPRRRAAPLILYFDTSALIKLLIPEEGSELAEKLWRSGYSNVSSILAYPEGRAALAKAVREDRLSRQNHRLAVAELEELQAELIAINVDHQLAHEAGQLAADFNLRGYDSVHLATALELGEEDESVLVTWDAELARAATAAGLGVAGVTGW